MFYWYKQAEMRLCLYTDVDVWGCGWGEQGSQAEKKKVMVVHIHIQ